MTPADAGLYVQRSHDLAQIETGLSYGFNVIVLGERGAGKTTLLNVLEPRAQEVGHRITLVTGGAVASVVEALDAVARALDRTGIDVADAKNRTLPLPSSDPLIAAYDRLAFVVARGDEQRPVVLLDHLPANLCWELFGRLRDELWTLELQWVVTGNLDDQARLLAPPADAFFEHTVYLTPFNEREIVELIDHRDPEGQIADDVRRLIAERCEGNPSRALALARRAVLVEDQLAAVLSGTIVERIDNELGRPAARLADELTRNGPAGPSDPDLLRRLGWSRPRAYQVFELLEREGYVEMSPERTGQPGRPRNTYRLREGRV
jgi:energy-coupling factor transporter ATP-binding protein EcfA2